MPGSTDPLYSTDHDPVVSAYESNTSCATNDIPLTAGSLNNLAAIRFQRFA